MICDNFSDAGTTLKVARVLERKFIGFDNIQEYVDLGNKRIFKKLNLREGQTIVKYDKI